MKVLEPAPTVNRFLTSTTWEGYLKFCEATEGSHVRLTYDRGSLELMTTSEQHEQNKSLLAGLLEALMQDLGIGYLARGSMTFRRQGLDRGLEPDECYWLRDARKLAPLRFTADQHPPPELALEVEVSRSLLDRIGIYRALGVQEVWRALDDCTIKVLVLGSDGEYHEVDSSPLFPGLPLNVVEEHLRMGQEQITSDVIGSFRAWVRENLKPE